MINDVKVRPLEERDLDNGFLDALESLADTCGKDRALVIFSKIQSDPNIHIFVAELDRKIIGCHSVILEQKFIHNGGVACSFEDLAVSEEFRRKGVGEKLFLNSIDFARKAGSYKALHVCKDDLLPYYSKFGMKKYCNSMRIDF